MRWINKYFYNKRTRTITGQSATFNIYPVSGAYGMAKQNESFDAIGNIKSYVLQESLLSKNILFDNIMKIEKHIIKYLILIAIEFNFII